MIIWDHCVCQIVFDTCAKKDFASWCVMDSNGDKNMAVLADWSSVSFPEIMEWLVFFVIQIYDFVLIFGH